MDFSPQSGYAIVIFQLPEPSGALGPHGGLLAIEPRPERRVQLTQWLSQTGYPVCARESDRQLRRSLSALPWRVLLLVQGFDCDREDTIIGVRSTLLAAAARGLPTIILDGGDHEAYPKATRNSVMRGDGTDTPVRLIRCVNALLCPRPSITPIAATTASRHLAHSFTAQDGLSAPQTMAGPG